MLYDIEMLLEDPIVLAMLCAFVLATIVFILVAAFASYKDGNGKTMLGLVGMQLLMFVPILSTVMLFIWAFGEKTKSDMTFRNLARLYLVFSLFGIVFSISYFVFIVVLALL